jgi:1-acyl-sn-glycerol-3-phosphate acyltransferase
MDSPPTEPKPHSLVIRPEITRLPNLTTWRRFFRWLVVRLVRLLVRLVTRTRATGVENIPRNAAALIVTNHLGDADLAIGMAVSPVAVDPVSKADLYDYPVLGKLMDAYGVIWIHRGQPDRRAIRAVLDGLAQGRLVAIAPEGRESVTGELEEGTDGATYLALKSGAPIIPVVFTGTENTHLYGSLKHLRRPEITVTIGSSFYLNQQPERREAMKEGTLQIMRALAALLPPSYQGIYRTAELHDDC